MFTLSDVAIGYIMCRYVSTVNMKRYNFSMPTPKQYHHGNLRQALLDASLSLIREQGHGSFTLREVARLAGVSHTAAYRHFRDKQDLLAAIAQNGFLRLTAYLRKPAPKARTPLDRLQRAGIAYVEFALDHPEEFSVMFSLTLDAAADSEAKEAASGAFTALVEFVQAWKPAVTNQSLDVLTLARIAWVQVHGLAELARKNQIHGLRTRKEILAFAAVATGVLLHGLEFPSS